MLSGRAGASKLCGRNGRDVTLLSHETSAVAERVCVDADRVWVDANRVEQDAVNARDAVTPSSLCFLDAPERPNSADAMDVT